MRHLSQIISFELSNQVLRENLNMHRVATTFVLQLLTINQKIGFAVYITMVTISKRIVTKFQ